jgi:hypothetical protein
MTQSEITGLVRKYLAEGVRHSLRRQLIHGLRDPFQVGKDGRFRIDPQWVLLGTFSLLLFSVFLYFNFIGKF